MPDALLPVKERILLDVVKTLENISAASGYSYTLTVERPNPGLGNPTKNNGAIVIQGDPQRIAEGNDDANGLTEWHLPISVLGTVVEKESSVQAIDSRLNIMAADIERALCKEGSHSRAGLAFNTWVVGSEQAVTEYDAHVGQMIVHFIVHFRHRTGDPFTQG